MGKESKRRVDVKCTERVFMQVGTRRFYRIFAFIGFFRQIRLACDVSMDASKQSKLGTATSLRVTFSKGFVDFVPIFN